LPSIPHDGLKTSHGPAIFGRYGPAMVTDAPPAPFDAMIAFAGIWVAVVVISDDAPAAANDNAPSAIPGDTPLGAHLHCD